MKRLSLIAVIGAAAALGSASALAGTAQQNAAHARGWSGIEQVTAAKPVRRARPAKRAVTVRVPGNFAGTDIGPNRLTDRR